MNPKKLNLDTVDIRDLLPYEALTWNYVRGRIDRVLSYVDKEEAPPWEFTSAVLDGNECKTCDYLHICNPPTRASLEG
jgi:hypothetical protein